MKYLKVILDFYLKSSTHVSLAVMAFAGITMLQFDIETNPDLLIFIFLGTVTGYNFVKYMAIAKLHHFSLSKSLRAIQIFSFFCFAGLLLTAMKLPGPVLWAAAALGGLNVIYALPLFSGKPNLRSITGVKIFIIALVWTGVTVWLPILDAQLSLSAAIGIASVQRFLFVMVLILPFDIRDVGEDTKQLGTVPQLVGIENTRNIGILLLVIILLLELIQPIHGGSQFIVLFTTSILTAWLIHRSAYSQNKYLTSFWVEGVPIFWWFLLLIINFLQVN